MAATALVNFDLDNAERAIQALDAAGLPPNVAMWAKLPDYENWRLVIASDKLDQDSLRVAYSQINDALRKAGIPIHLQPTILMLAMKRPIIQDISKRHLSIASSKSAT